MMIHYMIRFYFFFFFQAEDGIRDLIVTGVQTCALPISHNLFPKKDDKDLSQIYNRLAKEGAKLRLGLVYATQEVSSISGNVLKRSEERRVGKECRCRRGSEH